jgi:glycosyltransferase involved in cell wall biosynthesis
MRKFSQDTNPLISILTPTWNRAAYLERVWRGLGSQTYQNIEWIVCDDGSTDHTAVKLSELGAKSKFPVTVISANLHIGKARMDNEAVAQARGAFIIWCDSDDYLLPQAVAQLMATWNSIPKCDREDYVGVTALCSNEQGVKSTPLPKSGRFDTTWNDLAERFKVTDDMLHLTKASELKNLPFPEVDFVIPEGVVWTSLGHKRVRMHSEVLKVNEYKAPNCISFSGKMEYCRGRAYAMATSERNLGMYPRDRSVRWWKLITYIRCCLHGEIAIDEAIRLWGTNSSLISYILLLPIGHLLALKDRLQGKVRKTHRDFICASKLVTITCARMGEKLNSEPSNS